MNETKANQKINSGNERAKAILARVVPFDQLAPLTPAAEEAVNRVFGSRQKAYELIVGELSKLAKNRQRGTTY